jgi:hypothetical protein
MNCKTTDVPTRKKRHHYIPTFYLNGFVDPNNKPYIWVYEKGNPNVIKASARDIGVQKHFYSFPTPEGEVDSESFEELFEKIENGVAPIFQKIRAQENLNDEERSWFATFLAFIFTRVPNYRENVERLSAEVMKESLMMSAAHPEGLKSMMKRFEQKTGQEIDVSVEDYQKFLLDGQYDIVPKPELSLKMVILAVEFVPIFYHMKWVFLRATGEYKFVTSDNPLYYDDPTHDPRSFYGVGLLNKNVEITFPISKDLALVASWKDTKGYVPARNSLVKAVSRTTVISASRFVFSSAKSEAINRLVQRNKGSAPRLAAASLGKPKRTGNEVQI